MMLSSLPLTTVLYLHYNTYNASYGVKFEPEPIMIMRRFQVLHSCLERGCFHRHPGMQ